MGRTVGDGAASVAEGPDRVKKGPRRPTVGLRTVPALDGFSMMVTTIPVILPLLKAQHIDLVWFGVIAVMLTEAALISPPEGLNLYVIQGFRKPSEGSAGATIMDVSLGVTPVFLLMTLGILLIILFPPLAVWLPTTMKGQ